MGLLLSPSFQIKDLRCYIDFGTPRCYTTGSIAFDLSPYKNNATLYSITVDRRQFGGTAFFNTLNSIITIPKTSTLNNDPLESRSTSFWFNVSSNDSFLPPGVPNVVYKEGDKRTGIIVYVDGDYLKCELYYNNLFYIGIEKKFIFKRDVWHNIILNYFNQPPYFDVIFDLQIDDRNIITETIQESTTLFYNGEVSQYEGQDLFITGLDEIEPSTIILGTLSGHSYINQSPVSGTGVLSYNMRGGISRFITRSNGIFNSKEISDIYDSYKGRFGISESKPEIVTDGLVCFLDPQNPNSYDSSKLWNDITYNDSDGYFVNGSLSATDGKSIILDGIDENLIITSNSLKYNTKQPYTRIIWFKYNNINNTGNDTVNLFSDVYIPGSKLTFNTLSGIIESKNTLDSRYYGDVYAVNSNNLNSNLPELIESELPSKILNGQFDNVYASTGYLILPSESLFFLRGNKLFYIGRTYNFDGNYIYNYVDNKNVIIKDNIYDITRLSEVETPNNYKSFLGGDTYGVFLSAGNDIYYLGSSFNGIFQQVQTWTSLKSLGYNFNKISYTPGCVYALSGTKLVTGGFAETAWTGLDFLEYYIDPLGQGSTGTTPSPRSFQPVSNLLSENFSDIFTGHVHGFAMSGNKLFGTGYGPYAGMGLQGYTAFTPITGNWSRVKTFDSGTFVLSANTKKWFAAGENEAGSFGIGNNNGVAYFTPIPGEFDDIIPAGLTTFAVSGNKLFYAGVKPKSDRDKNRIYNVLLQKTNQFTYYKEYENEKIGVLYENRHIERRSNSFSYYVINPCYIFIKNINTIQDSTTKSISSNIESLTGWNMIVQSYNPDGENRLYVIGEHEQIIVDNTLSDLVFNSNNQYVIGQPGVGMNIGQVMIYNRQLNLSEVMENYRATKDNFITN